MSDKKKVLIVGTCGMGRSVFAQAMVDKLKSENLDVRVVNVNSSDGLKGLNPGIIKDDLDLLNARSIGKSADLLRNIEIAAHEPVQYLGAEFSGKGSKRAEKRKGKFKRYK